MNDKLEWKTNKERQLEIANRLKRQRKALKLSREKLSLLSNVPSPTIRRFEDSGDISLGSLVAILVALNHEEDLSFIVRDINYLDIKDAFKND